MGPLRTVSCSEASVSRQCGVFEVRMSAEGNPAMDDGLCCRNSGDSPALADYE